jgi:hypothetical protein
VNGVHRLLGTEKHSPRVMAEMQRAIPSYARSMFDELRDLRNNVAHARVEIDSTAARAYVDAAESVWGALVQGRR